MWSWLGRSSGFGSMSLSQPEDWVAALSCRPLAVIVMHPLTRNPNYNSMKPCECSDLCCVCEREKQSEREQDDERLGLNHISKFGMSLDQRTAMVERERKRRGNDTRATKLRSSRLPSFPYSNFPPFKFRVPFFYSVLTQGHIFKLHLFSWPLCPH